MTDALYDPSKLGELVDELSILELREFMSLRFSGRDLTERSKKRMAAIRAELDKFPSLESHGGSMRGVQKLNARIWMLQHVESEIDKMYIGRPGAEPQAVTAIGLIRRVVMTLNQTRAQAIAKLSGTAVEKIY